MINVNVYSLWRDSASHINRTLGQLEELNKLSLFNFRWFFYENDSQDQTLDILRNWQRGKEGSIFSEKLNSPRFGSVPNNVRTALLSYYRNKNKELGKGVGSNYSLVFDSDLIFNSNDFMELFGNLRLKEDVVMVTSNCRQNVPDFVFGTGDESYYDVYCLRDKWGNDAMYFADSPFYNQKDNEDFRSGMNVEVKSAFGGLALIKSDVFDLVKWSADVHSEHVNFCYDVGQYGKILAIPTSRPRTEIDLNSLNIENCKKIAANEYSRYSEGNKLRQLSVLDSYRFSFDK